MRQRPVQIEIFAFKSQRVDHLKGDLIGEQIVEVNRGKGIAIFGEALFHATFQRTIFFRLQVGIGIDEAADAKRLFKSRLLDAGAIAKTQPGRAQGIAAAPRQESQRRVRHNFFAEAFVVHVAQAADERQSPVADELFAVERVVAPQSVNGIARVAALAGEVFADESVFIFKLVAEDRMRPAAWRVLALIRKRRAIEVELI